MNQIVERLACDHCQSSITTLAVDNDGHNFCCYGCLAVFNIIKSNNLDQYYLYRQETDEQTRETAQFREENFSYLDSPQIEKDYIQTDENHRSLNFYLEGIHCIACLWLIEKLPNLVPGVVIAKVNLSQSLVEISIDKTGRFSDAANMLAKLGYFPHPIFKQSELELHKKSEQQKLLIKIGIAAACAMNIMLFSVSIYGGATGPIATYFSYISLVISLPVVFFSALPFYQSSLNALKNKYINIDIPLSIAIIMGFLFSSYNVFVGSSHQYFDSITTLCFLILFSRYVLKKVQQQSFNAENLAQFFDRAAVRKIENGKIINIHRQYLEVGDLIQVEPGDMFPADGIITEGSSNINTSSLTGESDLVPAIIGTKVFAGTENLTSKLIVEVQFVGDHTRLGKVFDSIEKKYHTKAPLVRLADTFSQYFLASILIIAAFVFPATFFLYGTEIAFSRTLSLIIITCPCALGLAIPLTFTRALSLGAKKGIIIKEEAALEKVFHLKKLFLDKTGTLTYGQFKLEKIEQFSPPSLGHKIEDIIYALEERSKHPIARSLRQSLIPTNKISLKNYQEVLGKGVSGDILNNHYTLTSSKEQSPGDSPRFLILSLKENNIEIANIYLADKIRIDSGKYLSYLKRKGLSLVMLTGDNKTNANQVNKDLENCFDRIIAEQSPEQKAECLKNNPHSLMVGDGANDSFALSLASVGVAVQGSIDISLKVADIYLSQPGLAGIVELIKLSKRTLRTVYTNISFTIVYNLIAGALAILGHIGPLQAAILMPLSSLSVTAITLLGTRTKESTLLKKAII